MEKRKKQKQNKAAAAAAASVPPEKKIKKAQKKNKGKAPAADPTPSGKAQIAPSKAPERAPAPSGTTKITPSKAPGPSGKAQISPSKTPVPASAPLAQIALSKAPVSAPGSSGSAQALSAKQNGVKASGEGETKVDSGQRVAGFIFMCNGKTKALCYQYRIFGLPMGKLEAVQKIKKGAKLFLYDYELKLLYGIYKATCDGGLNLLATAFKGAFPAQVKFEVYRDCLPISEATLKQTIKDNYENKSFFKPELNSQQVRSLLAVFQPVGQKRQSANTQVVEERHAPPPIEERFRIGGPAHASTQVDPRYAPLVPNIQNDPYASAAHINRAPFFMDPGGPAYASTQVDPRYAPLVPNIQNDPYASAAHINRAPLTAAFGLPPPNDIYHPATVGWPPSNEMYLLAAGSVYQKDSRLHPQSSALLERYRAVPQMIPSEQTPAATRDYRSFTHRENEVVSRMDPASQYYHTDRAVASTAELPPQRSNWPPGYEHSSRIHADSLHRPISTRANMPNLPVSSLYSFAGAAPAYR